MKTDRQAKILQLIDKLDIQTQEELTGHLNASGFRATQATISRDIKELGLVKAADKNKRVKYVLPDTVTGEELSERLMKIFKESVISLDCAQNIVVVKTMPGLAPAACSALDGMRGQDIVGTIAGDDTGFIVVRSMDGAKNICAELQRLLV